MTENFGNILLLTSRADMGGGPKHVYDLGVSLKEIYPSRKIFTSSPIEEPFYIKFREFSDGHFEVPHRKFSLIKLFELHLFCTRNKIKIIHSHGRGAGIYSRLLKVFGHKVVHTFHGIHPGQSVLGKLKIKVEQFLAFFSDAQISVSPNEFDLGKKLKLLGRSPHLVPNGVEPKMFKETLEGLTKEEAREKIGIPKARVVLGTLTRLDPHKGNHRLIQYITDLPENFILVIAGDGPQKTQLEKLVEEHGLRGRVFLIGNISNPLKFLRSLDIYISASQGEGHPYSVLEALGMGVPCILSDVYGHRHLIDEEDLFSIYRKVDFKEKVLGKSKSMKFSPQFPFELKKQVKKIHQIYLEVENSS